jgi:exopolysaccharide production protein ExoQ
MTEAVARRGHDWEYWYTLIALLFITGALAPLLGILGGGGIERGDSNPVRLGFATLLYLIAGLLALKSVGQTLGLLLKNPLAVALLLLPLVSIIWSVEPELTFRRAVACALTTVFCIYLAARLSPEQLLKRLMFVLLLGGVASIFYSILLPQYGMHLDAGNYGAFRGVYGHKNDLGRVSVIALIVSYFVLPSNQTERLYRFLTLTIFLFLLAVSQSVTNWLIMMALAGFVPMLGLLRSERLSLFLRLLLVLSFGIAAIFLVASNAEALLAAVGRDDTFTGRDTLWRGVITVVSEQYPILGAGYGAFFSNRGGVRELLFLVASWGSIPEHAHNAFLNVWADLGAVGLLILVLFLVTISAHLLRRAINEPHRPAWGAFSALMFFFLVNSISSSPALRHSDIAWVLVLLISFYARAAMRSDVRPRPAGLQHGRNPVWPTPRAVHAASHAKPRSPTA